MKKLTILITGATFGIGRDAALFLSSQGHRVFATGRDQAALELLREEGSASGLETLRLDVTDAGSIAQAQQSVDAATHGRGLDVLINNAGYGVLGPTELITDDDLRAQYETNVFGLMAVTRTFVPAMRARGDGRVLNVSSLGGRYTLPFFGVYNSTKYAVESLSDALRIELAPFGVRVVLIEPGLISTGFTGRSMREMQKYRSDDSPYAPFLDHADVLRARSDRMAAPPRVISRAIARAATARWPRARYVAPFGSRLAMGLLRAMPTRWADTLVGAVMGLTRGRLAARSALPAASSAVAQ